MASKTPLDLGALVASKEAKVKKAASSTVQQPKKTVELKIASFRVRVDAKKQFGVLAKEIDVSEQALIAEAINLVFEKYGKPPIA